MPSTSQVKELQQRRCFIHIHGQRASQICLFSPLNAFSRIKGNDLFTFSLPRVPGQDIYQPEMHVTVVPTASWGAAALQEHTQESYLHVLHVSEMCPHLYSTNTWSICLWCLCRNIAAEGKPEKPNAQCLFFVGSTTRGEIDIHEQTETGSDGHSRSAHTVQICQSHGAGNGCSLAGGCQV